MPFTVNDGLRTSKMEKKADIIPTKNNLQIQKQDISKSFVNCLVITPPSFKQNKNKDPFISISYSSRERRLDLVRQIDTSDEAKKNNNNNAEKQDKNSYQFPL